MQDNDYVLRKSGIKLGQLRRVARLYHKNPDAALALGLTPPSFSRLCREHGIETPLERKRRLGA